MDTSYEKIELQYTNDEKRDFWEIAIGLNKVDNLEQSQLFYELMEEEINVKLSYNDMRKKLKQHYYKKRESLEANGTIKLFPHEEADLVGIRMVEILSGAGFSFSIACYLAIHNYVFQDVFFQLEEKYLGKIRDFNISKKEKVLNGNSVEYAPFYMINDILEYYFTAEKHKKYYKQPKEIIIKQIAEFTSNIWQAHPFIEGNTRTIALFMEKYIKTLQIPAIADIFKENSLYFRNALVLANAPNPKDITAKYLLDFFEKFLFNKEQILKPICAVKL